MNKIILMRHAISEGNEKQIIQGKTDFKLSINGINELHKLDLKEISNVNNIYSSDFKRTKETANIVKEKIKYDGIIKIDNTLREVSAGILDGKEKKYCAENLTDYYNIYLKRGDYNEIPFADNWQYTQARALVFLEKYLDNNEYCDLVVTHAAFMRCMINTILYRNRNTKVDIQNCKIYEFEEPLKNIKYYKYDIAKSSEVYKISCFDNDYIMKRKKGTITNDDINEKKITNYLSSYFNVPEIIIMENRNSYYIKILKYLEGQHKFGKLNESEIDRVTKQVYDMYSKLQNLHISSIRKKNILNELIDMRNYLLNEETKIILNELLKDYKFISYLKNSPYSLIHNDLHRSNILFDDKNINIIDFESIYLCPSILQLASYITTCYLIEEENNYSRVLNYWPEKYDNEILEKFIIYRLLYGVSFFDKKIQSNNCDTSDFKIKEKYIKCLRRLKNERSCN